MRLSTPDDQDATEEALHQGQARAGLLAIGACLGVKNIGKPCTGKPYARFDEGGLATVAMVGLLRHRQTKEAETDRPGPGLRIWDACPLLYQELTSDGPDQTLGERVRERNVRNRFDFLDIEDTQV